MISPKLVGVHVLGHSPRSGYSVELIFVHGEHAVRSRVPLDFVRSELSSDDMKDIKMFVRTLLLRSDEAVAMLEED